MATDVQGKVGIQSLADGAAAIFRVLKSGAMGVGDVCARYDELNYRDQMFSAASLPAGVAPGTALSTTPSFTLYNPTGSQKNLVLVRARCAYISGTLGGGQIVLASPSIAQPALPTGGTALVVTQNKIGNAASSAAKPLNGSTLAGTPLLLAPLWSIGPILATTAAISPPLSEEFAGEFTVVPGNFVSLQMIGTAGSTPLVTFGMTWYEQPISGA